MILLLWKEYGQLGNRLFTFSNLLAFTLENDFKLYNLSFSRYSSYFYYFTNSQIPSWPNNKAWFSNSNIFAFKPLHGLVRYLLQKRRFLDFLRYFGFLYEASDLCELKEKDIDMRYFNPFKGLVVWSAWNLHFDILRQKHRPSLVKIFRPSLEIEAYIDKLFASISSTCYFVGVHIRRGDYESYLDGRYFFSFDQYRHLMDHIQAMLSGKSVHFIVASNERVPSSLFSNLPITILSGTEIHDLYSLARCNLIVGPPSTFADWASFYGGTKRFVFTGTNPQII